LLLQNATSTGAVAALAAVNTSLSAAAGAISSMLAYLYYQERKTGELNFDLTSAMNGALGGLVAVTAGCAVVEYWAALLIGLGAGLVYLVGSRSLVRCRIDDACDAIPVHLFCGLWGTVAVGLLASQERISDAYGPNSPVAQHAGLFYGGGATLLACQVVEVLFIAGWAAATMTPFFFWLQYYGWLRVGSLEERVGLDRSYHGEQKKVDSEDDFKGWTCKRTGRSGSAAESRSDSRSSPVSAAVSAAATTGMPRTSIQCSVGTDTHQRYREGSRDKASRTWTRTMTPSCVSSKC
jgi:ammonia channel protein AmtB